MAIFDPFSEVYSKIISLLVSNSDFTGLVKAGNVVEYMTGSNLRRNAQPPADFPAVHIFQQSISDQGMMDQNSTFEQEAYTFDPNAPAATWLETITINYRVLILGPNEKLELLNPVVAAFLEAVIRSKGPRLGLGYPMIGTTTFTFDYTDKFPECAKVKRQTAEGIMPIQCTFNGSAGQLS